jgi:diadenosine tetraphosphate (Ap4A) HIT family hydrolase
MNGFCALCTPSHEQLLWRDDRCRVILVEDPSYPGFCRVIWSAHVAEMTDLPVGDQQHLMRVVLAVESVLRQELRPDKINLASLGNQVPHLHWHVIPRHRDDAHFPVPVWGRRRRAGHPRTVQPDALARALAGTLATYLSASVSPSSKTS